MDKIFQTLDQFIRSDACIFNFKSIDYPTEYQQHLITNYFTMTDILKTQTEEDVVKLLHTSDKYLQIIIPGLLYEMIIDPKAAELHFDAFMPSLRSQSWIHFGKLLLHLLQDSFLWIKPHLRSGIIPLLSKLHIYGQLEVDLVILAVKTIDYTDLSENAFNYNNQMFCFFHKIISEPKDKPFPYILAKTFFFKIFRISSLLICIDDKALTQYRLRLIALGELLMELQSEKCMAVCNSGTNFIKQVYKLEGIQHLCRKLLETCENREFKPESSRSASLRLASVLPLKVQTTLLFIIKEGISKKQTKLQLDWIFSQKANHTAFLVFDILRYILALPVEELPMKQCLYILEWLFYRICSNNILLDLWKDELFYSCFVEPCPFPAAPERVVRFLGYLIQLDIQFGQNLLIFLLYHYGKSYQSSLRNLFIKSNELQILNINELINNSMLRPRTRQQLLAILGQQKMYTRSTMSVQEPIYYDPLESMNRKQSEMSLEFSDSQNSYEYHEGDSGEPMNVESKEKMKEQVNFTSKVKIEKMFVEDLGQVLSDLLRSPSLSAYKDFNKEFISIVKEFKVSGEQQQIQNFITENAKITYLLFQNQFQEHVNLPPKEQNIVFFLINVVAAEWRSNSLQLHISKKIVKRLIQLFPTTEPTFWRNFLLHFRRSTLGHCKEIRDWLFPKQKVDYAVSLLRQLGNLPRELIQNAEQLKLPVAI